MSDAVTVGEIRGRLTLDDAEWTASVDRAKAQIDELTTDRDTRIKVRVDDAAALSQLAYIQRQLDQLRRNQPPVPVPAPPPPGGGGGGNSGSSSASAAASGLSHIQTLAIAAGAAMTLLGPLTATAVAGLSDVGAAAGVAALGFEGFKNQMAAGTTIGLALKGQIHVLGGELNQLEQTASNAMSHGVMSSLRQVEAELPRITPLVSTLGGELGAALSTTTTGVISGLNAMQPLLLDAGRYAEGLATSFANFTASDQFKTFVAYAQQELPKVGQDIADIGKLAIQTAVALQPLGDALLTALDTATKLVSVFEKLAGFGNGPSLLQSAPSQPQYQGNHGLLSFTPNHANPWSHNADLGDVFGALFNPSGTGSNYAKSSLNSPGNYSSADASRADYASMAEQQAEAAAVQVAALAKMQAQYGLTAKQADAYTDIVGRNSGELHDGAITLAQYHQALAEVSSAENNATQTGSALITAMTAFASSAGNAADKGALIGAVLKAGNGDALSYAGAMVNVATANQQFVTDFDNARFAAQKAHTSFTDAATGVVNLKTGALNYHNAAAGPLINDLQQLQDAAAAAASATYQHEVATKGQAQAATDAADIFKTDTYGALIAEATQLGLTADQAKALATQYFNMPSSVTTTVKSIGLNDVNETLSALGQQLSYLTHQPWTINVTATVSSATVGNLASTLASQVPAAARQAKAHGGLLTGPGTGTSDSILAAVSNGEFVNTAKSTAKNRAALEAANRGATLMAFADGGFVGVTAPTDPAATAAAKSSATAAKAAASLGAAQSTIRIELSSDVTKVLGAALGSVSAVQSAMASLISAADAGISKAITTSGLVTGLEKENNQLVSLANARQGILDKLSAAQAKYNSDVASFNQEKSSVASGIAGSLNITSLNSGSFNPFGGTSATGSISDAITALQGRVADAGKFKGDLATLQKLGLSPALIQQLAEAGVSGGGASAAELAGASKSQIAQINALSSQINTYGSAAGTQIAKAEYGSTIKSDANSIVALRNQEIANEKLSQAVAKGIAAGLAAVGVKVDFNDKQLDGLIDVQIQQNNKALKAALGYR